jgi:hypothetical protein
MADFSIRFITEGGFVCTAIRGFTFSQWSHAEIILPEGTYLGAHAGGGVQIRASNYVVPTRERRYSIPVPDQMLEDILNFAKAQIGKGYDYDAIGQIVIHKHDPWANANRWFCSELVAASANAGGLVLLNVVREYVNLITPEMLHLSTRLVGRCTYQFPSEQK